MIHQTQLEATIYDLISPSLEGMGYEIVRIRITSSATGKMLQIMIERIDGANVAMADCEKASRHISVLMDVENPIDSEYNLELSSTGLDRPMTRQKDFANNIGKVVKLSLKAPINGQKRFSGVVKEVTENMISLASVQPAEIIEIDFNNIVEAHLDYFAKNNKKTKKGEK